MEKVEIELCPETGICSIVRAGGTKTDLMPDEVQALREAGSDLVKIKQVVAGADATFAQELTEGELRQIVVSVS